MFLVTAAAAALSPAIQTRLMDVAGESQTLAAAGNHASLNLGNSLGAALGGVVIAAQWGYIAPVWVGLALCVPGIAFALAGAAADRRPGARPISGHGPQRSEASGRPVLDEDSVLDGATT